MGELSLHRMGGGIKFATGTFSYTEYAPHNINISGLGFAPTHLIILTKNYAVKVAYISTETNYGMYYAGSGQFLAISPQGITLNLDGFSVSLDINNGSQIFQGPFTWVAWKE